LLARPVGTPLRCVSTVFATGEEEAISSFTGAGVTKWLQGRCSESVCLSALSDFKLKGYAQVGAQRSITDGPRPQHRYLQFIHGFNERGCGDSLPRSMVSLLRQRCRRGVFDERPDRIDAGVDVYGFVKVLPTDGASGAMTLGVLGP
jgi:hypothetical protein